MMPNTVLETSDTQKKAVRPSSEELSFRGERQACDRQWPRILSHLRTFATQLRRGCGGGKGTKQKAVDMGRSGRPWPGLCLWDQFCWPAGFMYTFLLCRNSLLLRKSISHISN